MRAKQFYSSKAWKYFSRYILLYHSDGLIARCATCGKPLQINTSDCHAGHLIKVYDANRTNFATAFEFTNVLPQCLRCNRFRGGVELIMSEKIESIFGKGTVSRLRIKSNNICKLGKFEMDILTMEYKQKFKSLVEKKGNPWKKLADQKLKILRNLSKYQWQGEPVKVKFGNCIVRTNKERPLWWYNFECHPDGLACIPAIQVTTKEGNSFMLANHFGIGVHKLINGGWPNYQHFSLDGEFSTKPQLKYSEFDLDGFQQHEAERNKWQKENYPKEWEEKQALLSMITRR